MSHPPSCRASSRAVCLWLALVLAALPLGAQAGPVALDLDTLRDLARCTDPDGTALGGVPRAFWCRDVQRTALDAPIRGAETRLSLEFRAGSVARAQLLALLRTARGRIGESEFQRLLGLLLDGQLLTPAEESLRRGLVRAGDPGAAAGLVAGTLDAELQIFLDVRPDPALQLDLTNPLAALTNPFATGLAFAPRATVVSQSDIWDRYGRTSPYADTTQPAFAALPFTPGLDGTLSSEDDLPSQAQGVVVGPKGPGTNFLSSFFDRVGSVDIRGQTVELYGVYSDLIINRIACLATTGSSDPECGLAPEEAIRIGCAVQREDPVSVVAPSRQAQLLTTGVNADGMCISLNINADGGRVPLAAVEALGDLSLRPVDAVLARSDRTDLVARARGVDLPGRPAARGANGFAPWRAGSFARAVDSVTGAPIALGGERCQWRAVDDTGTDDRMLAVGPNGVAGDDDDQVPSWGDCLLWGAPDADGVQALLPRASRAGLHPADRGYAHGACTHAFDPDVGVCPLDEPNHPDTAALFSALLGGSGLVPTLALGFTELFRLDASPRQLEIYEQLGGDARRAQVETALLGTGLDPFERAALERERAQLDAYGSAGAIGVAGPRVVLSISGVGLDLRAVSSTSNFGTDLFLETTRSDVNQDAISNDAFHSGGRGVLTAAQAALLGCGPGFALPCNQSEKSDWEGVRTPANGGDGSLLAALGRAGEVPALGVDWMNAHASVVLQDRLVVQALAEDAWVGLSEDLEQGWLPGVNVSDDVTPEFTRPTADLDPAGLDTAARRALARAGVDRALDGWVEGLPWQLDAAQLANGVVGYATDPVDPFRDVGRNDPDVVLDPDCPAVPAQDDLPRSVPSGCDADRWGTDTDGDNVPDRIHPQARLAAWEFDPAQPVDLQVRNDPRQPDFLPGRPVNLNAFRTLGSDVPDAGGTAGDRIGEFCSRGFLGQQVGSRPDTCSPLEIASANLDLVRQALEIPGQDIVVDPPESLAELQAVLSGAALIEADPLAGPDGIFARNFWAGVGDDPDLQDVLAVEATTNVFDDDPATTRFFGPTGGQSPRAFLDGWDPTRCTNSRQTCHMIVGGDAGPNRVVAAAMPIAFPATVASGPDAGNEVLINLLELDLRRPLDLARLLALEAIEVDGVDVRIDEIGRQFLVGKLRTRDLTNLLDLNGDGVTDLDQDGDSVYDGHDDFTDGPASDDNPLCGPGLPGHLLQQVIQYEPARLSEAPGSPAFEAAFPDGLPPRSPVFCQGELGFLAQTTDDANGQLTWLWHTGEIAAALDSDADGVIEADDNCRFVANEDQSDVDGDGIGDVCTCGDASADGTLNSIDARLIQRCALGLIPCPELCDVSGDGVCDSVDARLVQRAAVGLVPASGLRCAALDGPP